MSEPIKFNHKEWPTYEIHEWTLVRIPNHLLGQTRPDKSPLGSSPVLGYIGQSVDEPDVPVVQLPDGKIQKCYCLYMVPPRKVLRYRRYITTACYGAEPTVFCLNENRLLAAPEKEKGFIRWIDLEWQEEAL